MDQSESQIDAPTAAIAERVRELRTRRGWSAERLAEEMTKVGVPWQRMVVVKLETGRRQAVSVTELLALSRVFAVAPVHLFVPLDDETPFEVTPGYALPAGAVRDFARGTWPLEGMDPRTFFSEVPEHEFVRMTAQAADAWKEGRAQVAPRPGTYRHRKSQQAAEGGDDGAR